MKAKPNFKFKTEEKQAADIKKNETGKGKGLKGTKYKPTVETGRRSGTRGS